LNERIEVPRERIERLAEEWGWSYADAKDAYISVVKDLAKNPVTLSVENARAIQRRNWALNETCVIEIAKDAQRRMFLAPEPPKEDRGIDIVGAFFQKSRQS
jgi:hypothetical protein